MPHSRPFSLLPVAALHLDKALSCAPGKTYCTDSKRMANPHWEKARVLWVLVAGGRWRGEKLKPVVNVSIFPQPALKKLTHLTSATVFFQARNSGQICAFRDLLGWGLCEWEQLCVPTLEMPIGIPTGRQTEEWDGFHVGTERERSGLVSCETAFWVWLAASMHICADIKELYTNTHT